MKEVSNFLSAETSGINSGNNELRKEEIKEENKWSKIEKIAKNESQPK